MKTKLFSAVAVLALVAPAALTIGSASADPIDPTNKLSGTSHATFDISADPTTDGILELKSVPDFNFGTVKSQQVFDGANVLSKDSDKTLAVSDARTAANDSWTLSAKMSEFTTTTTAGNDAITGALNLKAAPDKATGSAIDTKIATTNTDVLGVATSGTGHGTTTYTFAAADNSLDIDANATAKLTNKDVYSSTITWTLTSTTPQP